MIAGNAEMKNLLQAVETLLKSNNVVRERVAQLEKIAEDYEDWKAENAKLKGARYAQTCLVWQR